MNVKIGDRVLVCGDWGRKSVQTVTKITPKGNIRVSNGRLYDPSGMEKTSEKWSLSAIKALTPELEEQLMQEETIRETLKLLRSIKSITYKQALEINKILSNSTDPNSLKEGDIDG